MTEQLYLLNCLLRMTKANKYILSLFEINFTTVNNYRLQPLKAFLFYLLDKVNFCEYTLDFLRRQKELF